MYRLPLIKAEQSLSHGGVIAYPTETVFGLGCDPFCEPALVRLMILKGRLHHSGFILIGASWDQLLPFVREPSKQRMKQVRAKSKRPITWVFAAEPGLPELMYGPNHTMAVRVTTHSTSAALCERFGPLVSTSANFHGETPKRRYLQVVRHFHGLVDYIVPGDAGPHSKPSEIRDARTGKVIRS